ncbi:hypothetical protein U1Q18_048287 [Sarracenia purpurea var. burkii]
MVDSFVHRDPPRQIPSHRLGLVPIAEKLFSQLSNYYRATVAEQLLSRLSSYYRAAVAEQLSSSRYFVNETNFMPNSPQPQTSRN